MFSESARVIELDALRHTALVCGPQSSGKTSLLFHVACRTASSGSNVLFVTDKSRLYHKPPFKCGTFNNTAVSDVAQNLTTPFAGSTHLERIKMKYFEAADKESKRRIIEFLCHLQSSRYYYYY